LQRRNIIRRGSNKAFFSSEVSNMTIRKDVYRGLDRRNESLAIASAPLFAKQQARHKAEHPSNLAWPSKA
jgi:hypothetical protein